MYDAYDMPAGEDGGASTSDEELDHENPERLLARTTVNDDLCMNPLRRATVFHCKTCRHVLTDSTAVVATCGSLDSLIINGEGQPSSPILDQRP